MKSIYLAVPLMALAFSAGAVDEHPPERAGGATPPAATPPTPAADKAPAPAANPKFDQNLKRMQTQVQKIRQTANPQERQKLMRERMTMM